MSTLKSQVPLSNADGYLSDGSWCSDFDDSPETSDMGDLPSSEDYSQEIKDNQINENLEAELANATYVNTQPPHMVPEVSPQAVFAATNAPPNEILTNNLGAIPKTAFSYLNNDLNRNIKSTLINKGFPRNKKHLKERNPDSRDKPSLQPFNQSINSSNGQKVELQDSYLNKSTTEVLQDSQKSNTTIATEKTPSKLKLEAFSFLNRVIDNQSNKEITSKIFKEQKKHFVPTAFGDAESLKRSPAFPKYPENYKYECIEPVPTAPSLSEFQKNPDESVDHTLSPTNAIKFVTTLQKQDKEIIKPPLPSRPPPVFKYPLGIFSQQLPKTSNNEESQQKDFILPTSPLKPSSVQIIPEAAKGSAGNGKDIKVEFEKKDVSTANVIQCIPKRADVPLETCIGLDIEGGCIVDEDKSARKATTPIDTSLPNFKNLGMSIRPLPPVPNSRESKMTQNNKIHAASEINKTKNVLTKSKEANSLNPISPIEFSSDFLKRDILSDSASEETVPIIQNTNSVGQILQKRCVPDLKPKPRHRLDIIGHQTNVSSETFNSQHLISAAITARLQNHSSMKTINDSYEKPKNQSASPTFSEQEALARFSRLNMEPKKPEIPSREENNPTSKGNSSVRKISDIDELQQAMARPCLPQKLKTTQRSLSCTSLVQTFKDMSFSLWNHNDKDKRNSEGRNSFESVTKNVPKEIKSLEKAKAQSISIACSNDQETIRKVVLSREENIDVNQAAEKPLISRFAWYHHISARDAQHRLLALDKDGTFLIRPSSTPTAEVQYTTCVVYCGRVLNLHIRQKANGQYALGKEKTGEKTFSSLSELIKYHQDVPIEIRPASRSSSTQELIYVYLRITPPK